MDIKRSWNTTNKKIYLFIQQQEQQPTTLVEILVNKPIQQYSRQLVGEVFVGSFVQLWCVHSPRNPNSTNQC